MSRATVHLELVTPCFLGGADQKVAEWRAGSIRGQLRWWFRAVAGGAFGGDLRKTKAAEAEVFGSTEQRSSLRLQALGQPKQWATGARWPLSKQMKAADLAREWKVNPADPAILGRLAINVSGGREIGADPLQYLSYGCVGYYPGRGLLLDRACFAPGETGEVRLQWSDGGPRSPSAEVQTLLTRALWAWLHLGGLGSKSRNGFGSLRWTAVDGALPASEASLRPAKSVADLEEGIRSLFASCAMTGPPSQKAGWTQLGPDATVHLGVPAHRTWHDALAQAGAWLIAYRRRYGLPTETRQRDGQSLANRDYTWAPPGASNRRGGLPDRAGFGLPLPFGQHGETATWWLPKQEGSPADHRRASPLQIHIAQVAEGFIPVLTHLPAQFLPDGAELAYTKQRSPSAKPEQAQLGVIEDFLGDLTGKNLVRKVTP